MTASQPFDFGQAQAANQEASARQRAAETFIVDCAKQYAEAERVYREALAAKILALKAEGVAWTSTGDIARGDATVAALKARRDVADGMREAAVQAAWRASKDRDAVAKFCEWSLRRDLAEGHGDTREPERMQTYGGRRAA